MRDFPAYKPIITQLTYRATGRAGRHSSLRHVFEKTRSLMSERAGRNSLGSTGFRALSPVEPLLRRQGENLDGYRLLLREEIGGNCLLTENGSLE